MNEIDNTHQTKATDNLQYKLYMVENIQLIK